MGIETFHKGAVSVKNGGLSVGVNCCDAVADGLEAAHLGFDAPVGLVSYPSLPKHATELACGTQAFVAGLSGWATLLPRSTIVADRDDCSATPRDDGAVEAASIVGAICALAADLFLIRDLGQ